MTEQLLETIATQGILGIFLVLALVTIYFLYCEVRKERNSRLDDLKSIWEGDIKERVEQRGLLDTILELLRNKK
jgi:hypothetical protein